MRPIQKNAPRVKRFSIHTTRLLAVLLTLGVLLTTAGTTVFAESTSKALSEAKQRQTQLNSQIAALDKQTKQLADEKNAVSGQLSWLNTRSTEQRTLFQEKSQQLTEAFREMANANQAYIDAGDTLEQKQEQYEQRMQTMFAHRDKSWFEIFIEAGSLKNFFATVQFMSMVAEADQQMMDDLKVAKDDAELKKAHTLNHKQDMEVIVAEITAQLEKIKTEAATTASQLQGIEIKLSSAEKAEEALNAESENLGAQINALAQKLVAEQNAKATAAAQAARDAAAKAARNAQTTQTKTTSKPSTVNSQGWVWPLPSSRSITSYYGWRTHPVYRVKRFHSGIDINGDYGDPIVAARSGTVIIVNNPVEGRNTGGSGYGNYIVIAHDGGFTTLYGHLKSTRVREGQYVKAGDKIGACGSTGTSTGAHLHFEIRINGSTTNPLPYVK